MRKQDGRFNERLGKNLLINGCKRVNQRGFDGTSFVDGEYCWDRWKATATAMVQIVEEGFYTPDTVHTLSWEGGTPQQVTSPASGHWTIPEVPRDATNIQLEKGSAATEFERRPLSAEELLCYRYYYKLMVRESNYGAAGSSYFYDRNLPVHMRIKPTLNWVLLGSGNLTVLNGSPTNTYTIRLGAQVTATGDWFGEMEYYLDAEL